MSNARAEYDPAAHGFTLTFAIDEGQLYRFGDISVASNVPGVDPERLRRLLLAKTGATFDGSALDKSTDALAVEMAKLGYPFAHAEPRICREADARERRRRLCDRRRAAGLCRTHRDPRQT